MDKEGPCLEPLLRRLSETPEDFLAEPMIGESNGTVYTAAVVGDLLRMHGYSIDKDKMIGFAGTDLRRDRNRLSITLLLCSALADDWFIRFKPRLEWILNLLMEESSALSSYVTAKKLISDPDRREELARLILSKMGLRPAGETAAQARDRLTTLSSSERARVIQASRIAEARAQKIREALKKKAAEESADKWTRE
ncbi:hypothetical protein JXJ21_25780 [candidate division KSB1 bacterium]|nr:hypothetical protein [candidate division KSB1 bacterium]